MKMSESNANLPAEAPAPGVYAHYKGQHYQVSGMARHSETEEWLVVYQALYGERGFWLRPLSLWLQPAQIEMESGPETKIRFKRLNPQPADN